MARGRPLLRSPRTAEVRHLKFLPPSDAVYIRDWTRLTSGEKVAIVQDDEPEISGFVDAVTEDGLILWLHLDAGAGRKLFTRTTGALVWRLQESR